MAINGVKIMVEREDVVLSQPVQSPSVGKVFQQKYFDDRVFLSPLFAYNKIIFSKHSQSVSPALIGFSTHFLEEFVAAWFILIIQPV